MPEADSAETAALRTMLARASEATQRAEDQLAALKDKSAKLALDALMGGAREQAAHARVIDEQMRAGHTLDAARAALETMQGELEASQSRSLLQKRESRLAGLRSAVDDYVITAGALDQALVVLDAALGDHARAARALQPYRDLAPGLPSFANLASRERQGKAIAAAGHFVREYLLSAPVPVHARRSMVEMAKGALVSVRAVLGTVDTSAREEPGEELAR